MLQDFAEEIEADLLFRGIDVFDWYQGRISSRRLLVLLRHLPDDGAFKSAVRDDWNLDQHLGAATVTELRAMRADLWAIFRQEVMRFEPVLSPRGKRRRDNKRKAVRVLHDHIMSQLRRKKT